MNEIFEFLGRLYGLPGVALIFVLCVFICKGLRSSAFPNSGVWLVMLVSGSALNCLIADPNSNDPLNKVIGSYHVWMGKSAIVGAIAGQIAMTSYNRLLRKLPWFSTDEDTAERKETREADKG